MSHFQLEAFFKPAKVIYMKLQVPKSRTGIRLKVIFNYALESCEIHRISQEGCPVVSMDFQAGERLCEKFLAGGYEVTKGKFTKRE